MTRYKPGDRVKVRDDLIEGNLYYMDDKSAHDLFVDTMTNYRGKIVTINSIDHYGKYRVKECEYNWTDEMFSEFADEELAIPIDVSEYL